MDRDAILQAVEAERLGLADLLDGLDPGEWERKSLCDGSGGEVSGPIGELLLLSTGRPAGLERVAGDGAGEAARRVLA
jgi:hypothetical protein